MPTLKYWDGSQYVPLLGDHEVTVASVEPTDGSELWVDTSVAGGASIDHVLKSGDTMTDSLKFDTTIKHNLIAASVDSHTASVPGAMLITFPGPLGVNLMGGCRIRVYNYSGNGGEMEVNLGGYQYTDASPFWRNTSARFHGPAGFTPLPVHFLSKGSAGAVQYALALGDTNWAWNYPQVTLEVWGAYNGGSTVLAPGYTITFVTSFSGWTTDVTRTLYSSTDYEETIIVPTVGWSIPDSAVTRNNGMVTIEGLAARTGGTLAMAAYADYQIGTVPATFRPKSHRYWQSFVYGGGSISVSGLMTIQSGGGLYITPLAAISMTNSGTCGVLATYRQGN